MANNLSKASATALTEDDLLRDEPLDVIAGKSAISDDMDLLNHRSTAATVAQLVGTAKGHLNIAVFGPWGSGKSSFFGLLNLELKKLSKPPTVLRFDAWQNAGSNFQANFLASIAEQIGKEGIEERLFSSRRSVRLPLGLGRLNRKGHGRLWVTLGVVAIVIAGILPFIWTAVANLITPVDDFWSSFVANALSFWSVTASGSILFLLFNLAINIGKVDVEESKPSYVAQFRRIFDEVLDKRGRYAIFIDELDRCSPDAVMDTLEGLRTFLGHDRCTFVVAFDRTAVSATIAHHSRGATPLDPASPYYATAGEYLDKIFQFQISLPPQPAHVSRRYALSLVREKGGVWGDLRNSGDRALERVVSAVAPIHLRSPRRTKVLLNDFAVNARLYSSMGFNWIERSEEIAVWTTIQTEFPIFAKRMESDPRAIQATVSAPEEPGEAPESGEVIVTDTDLLDENASRDRVEKLSAELNAELTNYLRRLIESNFDLPRQDLVLMHAGGDLLRFDDIAVYNILLDLESMARSRLTELLVNASRHDRGESLRFLLEQLESAVTEDERKTTELLIGQLYCTLERISQSIFSTDLARLWSNGAASGVSDQQTVQGYLLASIDDNTGDSSSVRSAVDRAVNQTESTEVINRAAASLEDETFAIYAKEFLDVALAFAAEEPASLVGLLQRAADVGTDLEESEVTARLSEAFHTPKPAQIAPASTSASAVAAADEANRVQNEVWSRELASGKSAVTTLAAIRTQIRHDTAVFRILQAFLLSPQTLDGEEALSLAEVVLRADWAQSTSEEQVSDLLQAMISRPTWTFGRWREHVVEGRLAPAAELARVTEVVTHRFATIDVPEVKRNAVANLQSILSMRPDGELDLTDAISHLDEFINDEDRTWNGPLIGYTNDALETIATVGPEERAGRLQGDLIVRVAAQDPDDAEVEAVLAFSANPISPTWADAAIHAGQAQIVDDDLLLQAWVRISASGGPTKLDGDAVTRLAAVDAAALTFWIRSRPSAAEVIAVVRDIGTAWIDSSELERWASSVDISNRTQLWLEIAPISDSLAKIAAGPGIDASKAWRLLKESGARNNAAERSALASRLGLVPQHSTDLKPALLDAINILHSGGTQSDLRAASLLALRLRRLSGVERGKIHQLLGNWIEREPKALTRRRIEELTSNGVLAKKKATNIFDVFFGRR